MDPCYGQYGRTWTSRLSTAVSGQSGGRYAAASTARSPPCHQNILVRPQRGEGLAKQSRLKDFSVGHGQPPGDLPPEMGVKTPLPSAIRCSIHVCARPIRCSPGH